jgi:hypothetical protein
VQGQLCGQFPQEIPTQSRLDPASDDERLGELQFGYQGREKGVSRAEGEGLELFEQGFRVCRQ